MAGRGGAGHVEPDEARPSTYDDPTLVGGTEYFKFQRWRKEERVRIPSPSPRLAEHALLADSPWRPAAPQVASQMTDVRGAAVREVAGDRRRARESADAPTRREHAPRRCHRRLRGQVRRRCYHRPTSVSRTFASVRASWLDVPNEFGVRKVDKRGTVRLILADAAIFGALANIITVTKVRFVVLAIFAR